MTDYAIMHGSFCFLLDSDAACNQWAVKPQHTICEIFFLLFMRELRTIGLYY